MYADLIIAFTKEFESLVLHMHENTVKMTGLGRTNLYCFAAPAQYLSSTDVCCRQHAMQHNLTSMHGSRSSVITTVLSPEL